MSKQTAVEWLVEQVNKDCLTTVFIRLEIIEQALEMERLQIKNARIRTKKKINNDTI